MTWLIAGAVLGVAGSLHCAGMCGPLVLAINRGVPRAQLMQRSALYHVGRIFMYALLAIPAGFAAHALSFGMAGRAAAALTGLVLVASAVVEISGRSGPPRRFSRAWSAGVIRIAAKTAMLTRRHPHSGSLLLGAINGLLPCGLVYAAVGTAAASGNVASAVTFMLGFGAGTVPLLLAVTFSAATAPAALRRRFRFLAPALLALAGLLLLVRALDPAQHAHQHQMSAVLENAEGFGGNGGH